MPSRSELRSDMPSAHRADAPLRFTPETAEVHRLADGTEVRLRLLRRDDRAFILEGFSKLSPESRYRRFLTAMPKLPNAMLRRLLDVDDWNRLAIAAEAASSTHDAPVSLGLARFARLGDDADVAEAAVAVVDHMQGRGLGKVLLRALATAARERGISRFRAEVLRNNGAMQTLMHEIDEQLQPIANGPVAVYEVALPEESDDAAAPPLFRILKLAAEGLEILLRRLEVDPRRTREWAARLLPGGTPASAPPEPGSDE